MTIEVDETRVCLEQAEKYWQSQQWQATIEVCAKAIALDPQLPQAYKLMGDALQKVGKAKEAIGYYHRAIALQPEFAEVHANLGTLYAQQQQWQQAIDSYRRALQIKPDFTSLEKYVTRCQQQLSQSALENKQSDKQQPDSHNRYLEQGKSLQQQGELKAALEQYLKAIELQPKRVDTYREIVKLYERLEQWSDAAKYCRIILQLTTTAKQKTAATPPQSVRDNEPEAPATTVVDRSETSAEDYLKLGLTSIERGQANKAVAYYRRAIERQPKLVAAYLALGELLTKAGAVPQAIACYQQGLQQQPASSELYFHLGNLYQTKQKWSQAALCYQKVSQYEPANAVAFHELGEVLSKQEQWSQAVSAYRQAIALKPDFSWSHNNLGYALIQLEEWSQAVSAYRQAIALAPDFPWSYYNLAEALSKQEQWSQAIEYYQQAVEIQPDLPQGRQKLGDAFYRLSQHYQKLALDNFQQAIALEPNNPEPYHRALALDNRNFDLYLRLGDILAQKGDRDGAVVIYQMALQIQPKNSEVLARLQQFPGVSLTAPTTLDNLRSVAYTTAPQLSTADMEALAGELQSILPHSDTPEISIIIPVYNQLGYTLRCLKAIALNLASEIEVEIIVVNDCSTDRTSAVLEPIAAINLINNTQNSGFIHSCNQGAAAAKGKYLYFLNNDTEIRPDCIESLVSVFTQCEGVGAVGSKLIYPQGTLQEAGGIVWQDASGWNYGRQNNPHAPEYNYLRPVDYCSGASLMVLQDVFERLQGFERDFAPAYYEDTDLCFAIRHQLGLKVMYQPQSEVIHYEGISSGTSTTSGTKRYQVVNAKKFRHKWQAELKQYLFNTGSDRVSLAARRHLGHKTVLVIDSYMPCYDRESGSRRLFELLKILKSLDYHVIFAADNGFKDEPYTTILQNLQIEVLYTQEGYGTSIEQQIKQRLPLIDLAWICRPELNEKYTSLIRQKSEIKLIYDTIDLHYLRLKRAWELEPDKHSATEWIEMQAKELKIAHQADLTITVTPTERDLLQSQAVERVAVIPNIHTPRELQIPPFEQRSGILFIGSYNHTPNIDAVTWLCQEIMPLVWQTDPNIQVTLLGNNPSAEVMALESEKPNGIASQRITVTGYIADVSDYFLSHRLSVSPLRYGAGMKGKIGQSLEYALPVISTSIGTEGMNLVAERDILEADNTEEFARQILRIYHNADLWNLLSGNGVRRIASYTPAAIAKLVERSLNTLLSS